MAEIKTFGALRFTEKAGKIGELTCPPYDIISDSEREAFLRANGRNIIRLELPREGSDPYAVAADTLREWIAESCLACDDKPGLYIYEELFTSPGSEQQISVKGFLCRVRLEEWEKGIVLPHEETLSKAKADRFNLMKATGCNFSAIYSLYFDENNEVYPVIEAGSQSSPLQEWTAADGIIHRLWRLDDGPGTDKIIRELADKKLYIADGHHRYETAVNYRNYLREQGIAVDENHPANFVMMMLVNMEHPGLVVLPTHRILHGLEGFNPDALLRDCSGLFDIEDCTRPLAEEKLRSYSTGEKARTAFGFIYPGGVKLLILKDRSVMDSLLGGFSDAYRGLDVSVLHTLVLERLLGIDKENMAGQKNLSYTRSAMEAFDSVENGTASCAFLLNATRIGEIAGVAAAKEKMPQKSTYFYPKIITGHVMNKLLDV